MEVKPGSSPMRGELWQPPRLDSRGAERLEGGRPTSPGRRGAGRGGRGALNTLGPVTVAVLAESGFHSLWTLGLLTQPCI